MWEAVEQMAVECTAVCTALPCGRWNATFGILEGPARSAPCKHLEDFFAVVLSDDADRLEHSQGQEIKSQSQEIKSQSGRKMRKAGLYYSQGLNN